MVLGSAVYAGHWLEPARELAERHAEALAARRVWLFSSGLVGNPPKPAEEESVYVSGILEATGARDHRVFSGKLDKGTLGFAEKAIVLALRVAEATSATGKPSYIGHERSPLGYVQKLKQEGTTRMDSELVAVRKEVAEILGQDS